MRVLVVYASRHGQTQRIAERIAAVTRASGAETHVFEVSALPKNIAPHTCDVVVIAGAVHFGKHSKALERFALEQRTNLAKVHSVFVSVSNAVTGADGVAAADEYVRNFLGVTGWTPDHVELVAGGEPYTRYGFFLGLFMAWHAKKLGRSVDRKRDYDFTDWEQVERLARSLSGGQAILPVPFSVPRRQTEVPVLH